MAESFDDINKAFNADPNGAANAGAYNTRLISAIGGASGADLDSQETQARSQLNDPTYGSSAQARLDAITARRSSLSSAAGGMMQPTTNSGGLNKPVVAAPAAGGASTVPGYTVNGKWTPQDDSSATRAAGMVQAGSAFIDAAQADADKAANRKGMLNSSMATEAGTEAAIKTAQPFALQDAAQTAQKNLTNQQGYQALEQGAQQGGVQLGVAGLQSDTQLTLQQAADKAAMDRTNATGANNLAVTQEQGKNAVTTTGMNNATTTAVNDASNATSVANTGTSVAGNANVNQSQIQQNNRSAALTAVANADSSYTSQYNAIMANPNLPFQERQDQLLSIKTQRESTLRMITATTGIQLNWDTSTPAAA